MLLQFNVYLVHFKIMSTDRSIKVEVRIVGENVALTVPAAADKGH
jgi:hypothetical protein